MSEPLSTTPPSAATPEGDRTAAAAANAVPSQVVDLEMNSKIPGGSTEAATVRFATATFDEGGALEPAEQAPPRRRRGRPRKALARTVFDNTPITSDEMAFLRATVQGVSPHRAALHFLPGDAHQDGRAARPYLRQLLDRLHDVAGRIQTLEPAQQRAILAELRALRREAADPPPKPKPTLAQTAVPSPVGTPSPAPALGVPAAAVARAARARRPTLDEFAAQFDADMFPEAELIERYQEEFPDEDGEDGAAAEFVDAPEDEPVQAAPAPAPRPRELAVAPAPPQSEAALAATPKVRHVMNATSRLALVEELAQLVAIRPTPAAPLAVWLGEKLAAAMRAAQGLTTLEQLAIFINAHGTTWHQNIPTLGPARAARLARWIDRHAERIGVRVRRRIMAVLHARAQEPGQLAHTGMSSSTVALPAPTSTSVLASGGDKTQIYGLVPLDMFAWPPHLLGDDGVFRSTSANAYRAGNDAEALHAWLRKSVINKALPTQEVVRRAVERLALWALVERRCALSSLGSDDLVAFREFLYAPPAHWCGGDRVMRVSEDWRPLRGPLKEAGVRQVLVFVRQMFADWHASGYLQLNPAHGLSHHRIQTPSDREQARRVATEQAQAMTMNVRRSFVREDLEAMGRELAEMPDGPARRRLRAILSLYLDSGLRKSEVEWLTLGTPVPVRLNNELSDWMQVTVIGKGNKPRAIPIRHTTLEALEAHYLDRLALIGDGTLPARYGEISREDTPVLSILRPARRTVGKAGPGMTPADAPRTANKDGRLGASSVADVLKDFFKRVGQRSDLVVGQADFAAASTHWLRHTFAHRVIAETDAKLPTVQKLLGHQSLATTGIYLDADMSDRVRAVAQLRAVF